MWDKGELSKELDGKVFGRSDVKNLVDRVIGQDAFVAGVSRKFGIRKALIQTVATWEDWRVNPADIVGDLLVQESHAYRLALLEAIMNGGIPPLPPLIENACKISSSLSDSKGHYAQGPMLLKDTTCATARFQTAFTCSTQRSLRRHAHWAIEIAGGTVDVTRADRLTASHGCVLAGCVRGGFRRPCRGIRARSKGGRVSSCTATTLFARFASSGDQ